MKLEGSHGIGDNKWERRQGIMRTGGNVKAVGKNYGDKETVKKREQGNVEGE
jgi:hypothetical protein